MKKKIVSLVLISVMTGVVCSGCSRKCYCDPTPARLTPKVIMPS